MSVDDGVHKVGVMIPVTSEQMQDVYEAREWMEFRICRSLELTLRPWRVGDRVTWKDDLYDRTSHGHIVKAGRKKLRIAIDEYSTPKRGVVVSTTYFDPDVNLIKEEVAPTEYDLSMLFGQPGTEPQTPA